MTSTIRKYPINRGTLNTSRLENRTEENTVEIPLIATRTNRNEYKDIFKSLSVKKTITNPNVSILIKAKEGQNILSYNGDYDYYLASYSYNGSEWICNEVQTEVTEEEANMLQIIIWKRRNIRLTLRHQLEKQLHENYTDIQVLCDNFDGEQYTAVYINDRYLLVASTTDSEKSAEFNITIIKI